MKAEKCNLPHNAHFRMWRASHVDVQCTFSACREPVPHAGERSPRAETNLHMLSCLLGVWRLSSACGGSVLTGEQHW